MLINSCVKMSGDRNAEGYGRLDLSKLKLLWKIALFNTMQFFL
jgi:hypothetical protein